MTDYVTINAMRDRMRRELPNAAFARAPWTAGILVVANIAIAGLWFLMLREELPWYVSGAISLLLGYLFFIIAIVAHDAIHGAIVQSRRSRYALTYFGFYPFFISPHLWDVWHSAHHSRTNTVHDPDANPCYHEAQVNWFTRTLSWLMPSRTNRVVGVIFYFYWFTADAQAMLWNNRGFKELNFHAYGFDKRRAVLDTVAYVCFWAGFVAVVGPQRFVWFALIPMMLGNALFMLFATSEHIYLPRTPVNDALANTVSAKLPKILDVLTLNFSHHVEHHLFPNMSLIHLPLARAWLRTNMRERYLELTLPAAMKLVFQTERLYKDDYLLVDRHDTPAYAADTREITRRILPSIAS